jgi:hypothetical protein
MEPDHSLTATPLPTPVAWFDFECVADDRTADRLDPTRVAALVEGPDWVEGKSGRALRFNGDNSAVCRGVGAFNRTDAFSFSLWLRPTEPQARAVVFHRSRAWTDSGSRGYELVLESMRPAFALVHFWPGNALQVRAREPLPLDMWSHLTITYDGSSRASGLRLIPRWRAHAGRDRSRSSLQRYPPSQGMGRRRRGRRRTHPGGALSRFRVSKHGEIDEFQVFDLCLTPIEVRALHAGSTPERPRRRSGWPITSNGSTPSIEP